MRPGCAAPVLHPCDGAHDSTVAEEAPTRVFRVGVQDRAVGPQQQDSFVSFKTNINFMAKYRYIFIHLNNFPAFFRYYKEEMKAGLNFLT